MPIWTSWLWLDHVIVFFFCAESKVSDRRHLSDLHILAPNNHVLAHVLAPRLSVVFRRLLRLGSFPACWRQANVTPIPKGPSSSSVANYRPISITPLLSNVFERLVAVRLGRFMEHCGVLPTTQFADRKGLCT